MSDILLREFREGVEFVRLNRPEKRNAFNRELSLGVVALFDELEADDNVRVVVLTGVDGAFSAGADMTEALAGVESGSRGDQAAQAIGRVARFAKPLIGAVNGYAFGGGAVLALACDLRLASDRASFRFPGASYGLVVGGSQLPRIVGPAKAKELIFTARVVEADEAERIGLVNRVVPHDELEGSAWELALQVATQSPSAVRWSKAVIDASTIVEKGIEQEIEANRALRGSDDHVARFRAATERVAGQKDGS
ncbi:MAG: enoyl-CoA hydratase/isomerase family protein [Dehalococcoidia bacterium]